MIEQYSVDVDYSKFDEFAKARLIEMRNQGVDLDTVNTGLLYEEAVKAGCGPVITRIDVLPQMPEVIRSAGDIQAEYQSCQKQI